MPSDAHAFLRPRGAGLPARALAPAWHLWGRKVLQASLHAGASPAGGGGPRWPAVSHPLDLGAKRQGA